MTLLYVGLGALGIFVVYHFLRGMLSAWGVRRRKRFQLVYPDDTH